MFHLVHLESRCKTCGNITSNGWDFKLKNKCMFVKINRIILFPLLLCDNSCSFSHHVAINLPPFHNVPLSLLFPLTSSPLLSQRSLAVAVKNLSIVVVTVLWVWSVTLWTPLFQRPSLCVFNPSNLIQPFVILTIVFLKLYKN